MNIDLKKPTKDFLFIPLGGCGEIGMNMNLYHYKGTWIMLDCGAGFAEERIMPGVDLLVPNISAILDGKIKISAIVLTHAHEDHIGAVAYTWRMLKCPIYASPFAANFLLAKLSEFKMDKEVKITKISANNPTFKIGSFELEAIGLTHSIPEMKAICIKTEHGNILHTGDWKLDPKPVVGEVTDQKRLKELGDEGVLAMFCDSTNVMSAGHSGSEGDLVETLTEAVQECKQMVILTTFASNVARITTIARIAKKTKRILVVSGTSLHRIIGAAQKSGYLMDLDYLDIKEAGKISRNKLLVIATGCQGEPLATVAKLSSHNHSYLKLKENDTVIFSSKIIPGNEKKLFATFNRLTKLGVNIVTERDRFVHVSGHPNRDELKAMYKLVRPKISVPVHGEALHLHTQAKYAVKEWGAKQAVEMLNGDVLKIDRDGAKKIGTVFADSLGVDGYTLRSAGSTVLKERRRMQKYGAVVCSVLLSSGGRLLAPIDIRGPGAIDREDDADFLKYLNNEVTKIVVKKIAPSIHGSQQNNVDKAIRICESTIVKVIKQATKRELGTEPQVEMIVQIV